VNDGAARSPRLAEGPAQPQNTHIAIVFRAQNHTPARSSISAAILAHLRRHAWPVSVPPRSADEADAYS